MALFVYKLIRQHFQPEVYYYKEIISGDFLLQYQRYKFMNDGIEVFKNFLEIHEETLKHDVFIVY